MSNNSIVQGTLIIGRITAVFGVRGWVKLSSFTQQPEKIFDYQPWQVDKQGKNQTIEVDEWKIHGDGLVARLKGIDDRDLAQTWCGNYILVDKSLLPDLSSDDFYWHQLEGLAVIAQHEGQQVRLGVVKSLLETGANDVLVVKGDSESIDREERL